MIPSSMRCDNGCEHYDIPHPGFPCCNKNERGEFRSLSQSDIDFILVNGCASHTSATTITKRLITDTRTGKQYTTDLQQLCLDAGLSDQLTYCDIECLLTDGETWYMLDECGNWAYLPAWYKVEGYIEDQKRN